MNPATLRLFGARSVEELRASFDRLFTDETLDALRNELLAMVEGRTSFESETAIRTVAGEVRTVIFSVSIPPPPSSLDCVLVSIMDITDFDRPTELPAVPAGVALSLFRITAECLTNIAKHSGARSGRVSLQQVDDELHLVVEDKGRGFDPRALEHRTGLGFVSMRERLRLVRGRMTIHASPSAGARIHVRIPIASEETDNRFADPGGR